MADFESKLEAAIRNYHPPPKSAGRRRRGGVVERRGSVAAAAAAEKATADLSSATDSMIQRVGQASASGAEAVGAAQTWVDACKEALIAKLRAAVHDNPGKVAAAATAMGTGLYAYASANIDKIIPAATRIANDFIATSTIPERAADAVPAAIFTFAVFAVTAWMSDHPGAPVDEEAVGEVVAAGEEAAADAAGAAEGVDQVVRAGLDAEDVFPPGTDAEAARLAAEAAPPAGGRRRRSTKRHRHRHRRPSAPTRKVRSSSSRRSRPTGRRV